MRLASALTSSVLSAALLLCAVPAALAAPAEDLPAVESSQLSDASSMLALINPTTKLSPEDYTPANLVGVGGTGLALRPEAAEAVEDLIADARAAGHSIKLLSAYRSYQRQAALFSQYQAKYGTAYAERISARPGTSEHQLGLAADLGYTNSRAELKEEFGQTPAGIWIAEHAGDYGLIIRYPQGKEEITGYKYEPWHVRYIGKDHAKALAESGAQTYEDYFQMLRKSLEAPKEEAGSKKADKEAGKESDKDAQKAGHGVMKEDDLLVLRFLPPYRDWGFGFTEK
ncbi:M15 family metallopeptidase [Glutamicibacter halophytocola]|uniref:M15 family metallopeptidase n=1 Tax=Glutamicibacter halophytocola TaxID=1933880 RepID=A0ABX5Y8C3_9MICC|nr:MULTISPECIES: M15 family metallopeptidase [Glutamicibacter]MBF6672971.1 M15 family metallopeptidase [Glutamicibacter sp. FBE19]QDY66087.1 M15 family metallopeptidase [Glutamicibacter halophytocola]